MRVAAYTGGQNTPSARMRVRQYGPPLKSYGIDLREYTLSLGKSMPADAWKRPFWAAKTVVERAISIPASYRADLTLISRNLMPGFLPGDRWTASPRVLDVDDAIWLNRGGHRAGPLAASCELVLCGNSFLAEYYSKWNRNVAIVPTTVDTSLVHPAEPDEREIDLVIGWTGTSGNFRYLYEIGDALQRVFHRHPKARLRIIADTPPQFRQLDASRVDFVRWSAEVERSELQKFSVGIMPLRDTPWERGKCAFKMLLYMASGLPVVVSPVGMNRDVLAKGECGFRASTQEEWADALDLLLSSPSLARRMGMAGRAIAVQSFSVQSVAPVLAQYLTSVVSTPQSDLGLALGSTREEKVK
ncbi:glycosyltransferase [Edaphobacter paludis]|uniref:Glycosyltransferase n=1 Tax=Edaphobacter paludis TaxID=3035702 RepID=A0AAU7D5P4_9BACT